MIRNHREENMEANTIPKRPARVTLALYMLYLSLGISVITALVTWLWFGVPEWVGYNFLKSLVQVPLFRFGVPIWVMIYANLIILPVAVSLYYMIGKGRNWARITLLTYVMLETLFCIWSVDLGLSTFPFRRLGLSYFLIRISPEILQVTLHIAASALLFGRVSSHWFRAIKDHNKQAITKPKIGIPRVALGLLALLIVGVVLYQVVGVDKARHWARLSVKRYETSREAFRKGN